MGMRSNVEVSVGGKSRSRVSRMVVSMKLMSMGGMREARVGTS